MDFLYKINQNSFEGFKEEEFDNENLIIKLASIYFFITNGVGSNNQDEIMLAKSIIGFWERDLGNLDVNKKTEEDISKLPKLLKFKLHNSKNFINNYNEKINEINNKIHQYFNNSTDNSTNIDLNTTFGNWNNNSNNNINNNYLHSLNNDINNKTIDNSNNYSYISQKKTEDYKQNSQYNNQRLYKKNHTNIKMNRTINKGYRNKININKNNSMLNIKIVINNDNKRYSKRSIKKFNRRFVFYDDNC
ncbi:hypothetical protein DICPUDRAFT_74021 [Dictyostelium purpureum]|uniref:Uncharacterized protein n=1 Tax=Dictyostelium purpureum TaxID=5786 RepID=F0Z6J2_DICPU|nr:uncharacterized protein DICPUDRAFT_74021 [Dictyostelium purpureum]EGC40449.1 hypothetical protein DICPUDRAFT_74021 [Dictyostelium purpureum]|eukprot:XP_003282996.1 hypothetical protein DICPUDRAFT_74021 [Dictyostelium purpureum]